MKSQAAIFGTFVATRPATFESFLLSAFLHAGALALAVAIHGIGTRLPPRAPAPARLAHATEILIGDRLYYVTQLPPTMLRKPAPPADRPVAGPARLAPARAEAGRGRPRPRVFVPPEVLPNPHVEASLIQPGSPPVLPPMHTNVPTFRAWTANLPSFHRTFVVPGRRNPPEQVQEPAALTFPPAPELALPKGDALNVISMNNRPLPLSDRILVPPGNMVGRAGEGDVNESAEEAWGDRTTSALADSAAARDGAGSTANGAGAGTAGLAAAPVVITRSPTGSFDAVVVQSSPLDQFPGGKDLLRGRPIYTVYLDMGTAKQWALHFSVPEPRAASSIPPPAVIQLRREAPIRAPYPLRMVLPVVNLPPYQEYLLVHGFITGTGRLNDLRVVPPADVVTAMVLVEALAAWNFRPAERDGVPILVEILLSIPAAGL